MLILLNVFIFSKELKLLGHVVSGTTLKMDPAKVEAIEKTLPTTNVKELQSFLGTSCCKNLIKDYATIFFNK